MIYIYDNIYIYIIIYMIYIYIYRLYISYSQCHYAIIFMGYQRDQHLLLLEPEGMLVPSLHADLLKQQQLAIEKKLEDFELEAWLLGHFVGQLGAVWADGSVGYIAIEPIIRVV